MKLLRNLELRRNKLAGPAVLVIGKDFARLKEVVTRWKMDWGGAFYGVDS